MRKKVCVTVLLAACCLCLGEVCAGEDAKSQVSLDLGSFSVWLGMPGEVIRKKIASAGYKVSFEDEYSMMINSGEYTLAFKNGRLCFASRSWLGADGIASVVGALAAIAGDHDGRQCSVSHQPTSDPVHSTDRIFVECGQHSVLIMKVRFSDKNETEEVSERIGQFPQEALK